MHHGNCVASAGKRGLQLQNASRVAGCYEIRLQRRDVGCLAIAKFVCRAGLHQVVDAGRTATDRRFGNFREPQSGNLLQKRSGLQTNALGVLQVAGIVERDVRVEGLAFRARR